MQSPVPVPTPQAPVPPVPSPAPGAIVVAPQPVAAPLTASEFRALRDRRSEISNQLESATSRRNSLADRLRRVDAAARPGIEQRITLLDQRILQLENDLSVTGRQLTAAKPDLFTSTQAPRFFARNVSGAVSTGGTFLVVAITGMIILRSLRGRGRGPQRAALSADAEQRLERLEQGVDAIAIEVERIAEGQRFMTRVLTENREMAMLGVGQAPAEPVRVREREEIPVSRKIV